MSIQSMMSEKRVCHPSKEFCDKAYIRDFNQYYEEYKRSIDDPEGFWAEKAKELHWFRDFDKVFWWEKKQVKYGWFSNGYTNVSYNCLDRHLEKNGDKTAIIFQGEPEDHVMKLTYRELHKQVCRFANVLKKKGIEKGDRVCMYMPMVPELAIAMLACTRIGAIHNIVFGGFSAESLKDRILDSEAKVLITADGGYRGGKITELKKIADEAVKDCGCVQTVIVAERCHNDIQKNERDTMWHDEMSQPDIEDTCEPEHMESEEPLFILYTSGTTGKPKGVLHTTGGYLTYVHQTFKWIFDYHPEDIYWCTADIGWITGHSYIIYGPLSNAATTVMFEGTPFYPENDRFWKVVEKFKVSIFYTAPTAIRAIMRHGEEPVKKHDLSSLRLLGSVGEPINPEAWLWYYKVIGKQRCPIVDTWWQTETGGILITPLPGAVALKPGSATFPFPGVDAAIYREDGTEAKPNEGGYLVIRRPWPGALRTVWGDHDRFIKTYWGKFKDVYFAGDGARKDEEGYFWIMGRIDDVINVSGHRIGTAEVESALVSHESVSEAAVVPFPHDVKGQALYAFVTCREGVEGSDDLIKDLRKHVAKEIGPIAKPDKIQFADALPKTRSGKIMRRILKAIAEGTDVGNTTTLANPDVVDVLKTNRV